VPDGGEIVGCSPAFAVTTGRTVSESDIEVTPKKIAPSIEKTRTMAMAIRKKSFMG
jgi:hypothetical protein